MSTLSVYLFSEDGLPEEAAELLAKRYVVDGWPANGAVKQALIICESFSLDEDEQWRAQVAERIRRIAG